MAKKNFDAASILMAALGGGVSPFVESVANNIPNGDKFAPALPGAAGAAIVYFLPKYAPVGYGMIGASAASYAQPLADTVMQGFNVGSSNRMNFKKGIADRLRKRGIIPKPAQAILDENDRELAARGFVKKRVGRPMED